MTSLTTGSYSSAVHHHHGSFDQLSDGLVSHVRPRDRRQVDDTAKTRALLRPFTAPRCARGLGGDGSFLPADTLLSLTSQSAGDKLRDESLPARRQMMPPRPSADVHPTETTQLELDDAAGVNTSLKRKRSGLSRREQCRANQARYRNKQRALQQHLEQTVEQLRKQLDGLKQRRRDLTSRERISHSPWTIVAEAFHLLQTSFRSPWRMAKPGEMHKHADLRHSLAFLKESFVHDVAMGDVGGAQALLDQLRRYSLYFGDPQIQLSRIEEPAPGVMRATASLGVTVTEFTVRHVFPHLEKAGRGEEDEHESLREKLLGARLSCPCSIDFLLDEQCGRVLRVEVGVDFLSSLIQTLGSVVDASVVLDGAMFGAGCVIGDFQADR